MRSCSSTGPTARCVWERTYGTPANPETGFDDEFAAGLAVAADDSVYVTGQLGTGVLFLAKFSPDGDLLWDSTWGENGTIGTGAAIDARREHLCFRLVVRHQRRRQRHRGTAAQVRAGRQRRVGQGVGRRRVRRGARRRRRHRRRLPCGRDQQLLRQRRLPGQVRVRRRCRVGTRLGRRRYSGAVYRVDLCLRHRHGRCWATSTSPGIRSTPATARTSSSSSSTPPGIWSGKRSAAPVSEPESTSRCRRTTPPSSSAATSSQMIPTSSAGHAFVAEFTSAGKAKKANTWGGSLDDSASAESIVVDASGLSRHRRFRGSGSVTNSAARRTARKRRMPIWSSPPRRISSSFRRRWARITGSSSFRTQPSAAAPTLHALAATLTGSQPEVPLRYVARACNIVTDGPPPAGRSQHASVAGAGRGVRGSRDDRAAESDWPMLQRKPGRSKSSARRTASRTFTPITSAPSATRSAISSSKIMATACR